MWSKAKFVNRKFLMEEVYQQHLLEKTKVSPGQNHSCLNPCLNADLQAAVSIKMDCKLKVAFKLLYHLVSFKNEQSVISAISFKVNLTNK